MKDLLGFFRVIHNNKRFNVIIIIFTIIIIIIIIIIIQIRKLNTST